MDPYRKQAVLYRALAHPVRLHILETLARGEACVCHLTTVLRKPQPYVSQQLSMLRDTGLITDRRDGTLIYYRLTDERLAGLIREGRSLLQGMSGEVLPLPAAAEGAVKGCPCPRCQAAAGHGPGAVVSPELPESRRR